jgi:type IV secretory pathway VirB2 component (pilin)
MSWFVASFKWIMFVSGLLTCTMMHAVLAPQDALLSLFGETLEGPVARIVVRNWGALITLVGAMLIYGAFRPEVRTLVLVIAGLSKVFFIGLVLTYGRPFLGHNAGVAVGIDLIMVALFVAYLLGHRRRADTA